MAKFQFVRDAGENLLKRRAGGKLDTRAIDNRIKQMGLGINDLLLTISEDEVKAEGLARNFGDREKAILLIGNVRGIASVDDQIMPEHPSEAYSQFHTVIKGETLENIAQQYYGDEKKFDQILIANHPLITHPRGIYPGQKLRVPPLNDV